MVQILVDNGNRVFEAGKVEKGIFPEADPNTELYKVTNDRGNFYAVANGFREYEVEKLPEEDYHCCTYTPEEGFVYHEPPKTQEQIQEETADDVTATLMGIADLYLAVEELKEAVNELKGA